MTGRVLPALAAAALLSAGCGDEISGVPTERITDIVVTGCANVEAGSTCTMTARAINAQNEIIPDPELVWFSTVTFVATVTGSGETGTLDARSEGTTTIIVSDRTRSVTGSTQVRVFPGGNGGGPVE